MEERDGIVGWVDVPHDIVHRRSYEVAAWYTMLEVKAGRYPLRRMQAQGGVPYWAVQAPGVIVSAYMASMYGGVAMGSSPQGEEHGSVGRHDEVTLAVFSRQDELAHWLEAPFIIDYSSGRFGSLKVQVTPAGPRQDDAPVKGQAEGAQAQKPAPRRIVR
jgi:hypothetical protein